MPRFIDLAEPITARDIKKFDQEAKELVADFQEAGWRGYLSNQGHAIMMAPDGVTTSSVSGHSGGPHLAKTARADLKRWQREQKSSRNGTGANGHTTTTTTEPAPRQYPGLEPTGDPERPYRCTDPACKDRPGFVMVGPAILHRQRTHDGLVCKDCGDKFPTGAGSAKAYSTHRMEKHGAKAPKKAGKVQAADDGKWHCEWCGRPFDTPQGRAGHRKSHKGEPKPAKPPVWQPPAEPEPAEGELVTTTPEVVAQVVEGWGHKGHGDPSTGVIDLEPLGTWIAGQDPGKLLTTVLATIAPPLVGEIERLRTERDGLRKRVKELETAVEEHQSRMSLFREVLDA